MARPQKAGIDYFPTWNPNDRTLIKINSSDFRVRYEALRNSSSGFIHREDVRNIILKRDNGKCFICGNKNNLQIDHIISVWQVAMKKYPLELLNKKRNLKTICQECNRRKLP